MAIQHRLAFLTVLGAVLASCTTAPPSAPPAFRAMAEVNQQSTAKQEPKRGVLEKVTTGAGNVASAAGDVARETVGAAKEAVTDTAQAAGQAAQSAADVAKETAQEAAKVATSLGGVAGGVLGGALGSAFGPIGTVAGAGLGAWYGHAVQQRMGQQGSATRAPVRETASSDDNATEGDLD